MANKSTEQLLHDRGQTYGDFNELSSLVQFFKEVYRKQRGWALMSYAQREAMDMLAVKTARILVGDPTYKDSWYDIGGYSQLGANNGLIKR